MASATAGSEREAWAVAAEWLAMVERQASLASDEVLSSRRMVEQNRYNEAVEVICCAIDREAQLHGTGRVLLLSSNYLFEVRTLAGLMEHENALLICPGDGGVAAQCRHGNARDLRGRL